MKFYPLSKSIIREHRYEVSPPIKKDLKQAFKKNSIVIKDINYTTTLSTNFLPKKKLIPLIFVRYVTFLLV